MMLKEKAREFVLEKAMKLDARMSLQLSIPGALV
ncbi:hypothetical protein HNQ56_002768 [Anaerotaenia torta]